MMVKPKGKTAFHRSLLSWQCWTLCLLFGALLPVAVEGQQDHLGQQTAERALSYLGTPYLFAGTGRHGIDCSGLVYRVYRDKGVEVPRTVRTQIESGTRVSGRLQEGDLLFFDTLGRGPSHVGIYIGNNNFVHAASAGPETGVIVSSLNENYYSQRYLYARRLWDTALPTLPASPSMPARLVRREPQDLFTLRFNSFLGLSSDGIQADRFEMKFDTGLKIGPVKLRTAGGVESARLSNGETQLSLYQSAGVTYHGKRLYGGGLQWDWGRWNYDSNSSTGNSLDSKLALIVFYGETGEQWLIQGGYEIPIPWAGAWQQALNGSVDVFYQPFHWMQVEAGVFSRTLSRTDNSGVDNGDTPSTLLDHEYGLSVGAGFRYPAAVMWGLQYRFSRIQPIEDAPRLSSRTGGLITIFVEYTF